MLEPIGHNIGHSNGGTEQTGLSSHLAISCERKVGETSALLTGKTKAASKAHTPAPQPLARCPTS